MAELPTPKNYAPAAGESAQDYATRIDAADGLSKHAVSAAKILAKAMEIGLYTPGEQSSDNFSKALDHISDALKKFDSTQGLAQADDRLMDEALRQVSSQLGRNISKSVARKLIAGKADKDLPAALAAGVNACWAEIKNASDVGDQPNVSGKDVVKSYKDKGEDDKLVDTELSDMVQEVLDLRDTLRAVGGGQARGGSKGGKRKRK